MMFITWLMLNAIVYKNGDSVRHGHYEKKPIPLRYSTDRKTLLVPLSKQQFKILSFAVHVLYALRLVAFVILFLGLPAQILTNISRGRPFDRRNMVYLRLMAIYLCIDMFLVVVAPYFVSLFFNNRIPAEFVKESFFAGLQYKILYPIAIAILLIIGKAFQRGYKLQQEQDLTK